MTLDLRTGLARPHRRKDYNTKIAAVAADERVPIPLWTEFLDTVMKQTLQRGTGPFPDLLLTHDPSVFRYETDVEKARVLLREAGVPAGTQLTYEYYTGFGKEAGLDGSAQQVLLIRRQQPVPDAA